MGCVPSKHLSQSSVVKLVRMRPPELNEELYCSPPTKTNINPGKSNIVKDGLF
jgi:hypothetical protein